MVAALLLRQPCNFTLRNTKKLQLPVDLAKVHHLLGLQEPPPHTNFIATHLLRCGLPLGRTLQLRLPGAMTHDENNAPLLAQRFWRLRFPPPPL